MPSEFENPLRSDPLGGAAPAPNGRVGRTLRRAIAACGAIVVLGLFPACSSSDDSSSTTTSPEGKEEVCAARDELEASVAGLIDADLLTGGTEGIQDAVDQVVGDLGDLKDAAGDDYGPQVEALEADLEELQDAVAGLGDGGVGEGLTAVGTAIAAVGTDASELFTQVSASCD
jgi:hypothetical protein